MVTLKTRGQTIGHTETVQLRAQFYNAAGDKSDLDTFPTITIQQPSGNILLGPTSAGVYHVDAGLYGFDYTVMINDSIGVWTDFWSGAVGGLAVRGTFNFVVIDTDLPAVNSDGYVALGDDPGFHYSQVATMNINKLLKALKARLNSSGKARSTDSFGNVTFVDCDIFSVDTLVTFLATSLAWFNELPHFTNFTFDDTAIINGWFEAIVQSATILALASKSLIIRGNEFAITDSGVSFSPPLVSELMNSQYGVEIANNFEKLKLIKSHMKPNPLAIGSFSFANRAPIVSRLANLRSRRIF